MTTRALVWFKRDLRTHDHAALAAAAGCDAALALWIVEPAWLASPEFDPAQLDFALRCVAELRARLASRGLTLLIRSGEAVGVLQALRAEARFTHLLSHEETGPGWTWTRDRAVAAWCRDQGVVWQEWPQNGVVRRLRTRDGWAARWQRRMDAPVQPAPPGFAGWAGAPEPCRLPSLGSLGLAPHGKALQEAGERAAWQTLRGFLEQRGRDYRHSLSSPLRAESGCSRLSPHLAFGTISLRAVHRAGERRIANLQGEGERGFALALRAFAGRLRWHCHFMQKLEDEPEIEFRNFARSTDGLRESEFDRTRFEAWCTGSTGFPMVDACMRSLRATGWLNFRMRAMLVSFAAYPLWLHWREPGLHLARQFVDFEAGIHWSQMQMQSGTTGINTVRVYCPTKQGREQDPQGLFIRRWLPELRAVPTPWIHEPWTLPSDMQAAAGCRIGHDYPAPIVDFVQASRRAKERLFARRGGDDAQQEADTIQQRHGSRKSGLPPTKRPGMRKGPRAAVPEPSTTGAVAPVQQDLFDAP